ncbi:nucleotide sugar dehydrogenase [Rhodobacteraceae bacterium nBUS_24]
MNANNRNIQISGEVNICVIGLGYVGLPLCIELAKHFPVIGYDINTDRVNELENLKDSTNEVSDVTLGATRAQFCSDISKIKKCNVFIVTVPTPIDNQKFPDFNPLIDATSNLAKYLEKNSLIVYESTVYPGATREICIPILEEITGFKLNENLFVAYSPERINPGDKQNSLINTDKLIGASNESALERAFSIYEKILTAGKLHKVESIEIAEAAKIIENTQRDVNIALMNEFSEILGKMGIPTRKVLDAAATKWNFHKYSPGLVGGHCIGVDPYYLINKANELGIKPRLIASSRYVNESVVERIVNAFVHKFIERKCTNYNILVVGGTFKENCPDIRNSKSLELANKLVDLKFNVTLYDPLIKIGIEPKFKFSIIQELPNENKWGGIIISILHEEIINDLEIFFEKVKYDSTVIFDLKSSCNYINSEFSL